MTGLELFAFALIMMAVSYAITASMAPKAQKPVAGQLDIPTAAQGGSVPVCFGENVVTESNVIWYGGASVTAIKTKGGKK